MGDITQAQIRNNYSKELNNRFKQLRRWAMDNWPLSDQPLTTADFSAAEHEIQLLLGAKLHSQLPASMPEDIEPQYLPVTPAPWP
ncbi:hypothetical protein CFter6_2435 [Collimonas fungivorans]|jgi:hypothetical protein|uniref:Uncharacterized protein n=1 Tax=Collimonas fungivorans TaxID=158899 RepID=A0A127PBJ6_9BURK|nr:hypothetical protein [Collimonas fungivorans]AMO95107.1 hypothetical protein CFter6_2435 [Collimonas fungivorans]